MMRKNSVIHGLLSSLAVTLAFTATAESDDGRFSQSPHGSSEHGVLRVTDLPRGSCGQCHVSHDPDAGNDFSLFVPNSNELCLSASAGGCHADQPAGATAGYPAQEADRLPIGSADPGYFEAHAGGVKMTGVENRVRWPGRTVWQSALYSAHRSDQDMPIKDVFGDGSCDNCHAVHGSMSQHDMLDTTYTGIATSDFGVEPESYALCLGCHRIDGPAGMDESSRSIAYFYDRAINPGSGGGHGVSTGGGYVPSGARLPCYDCHNAHGSQGYAAQGPNDFLLSDQRSGWYGLTDIRTDNDQVRRFCFGCHPASDVATTETVEGLTLAPLPATVAAHEAGGATHCYDCHGRDYSSPTANNIHNPSPGGDCVTCHAVERGLRRAVVDEFGLSAHHVIAIGETGTVTNNDCGVCHMEGSAQTGEIDGAYHANGMLELRSPDNGLSLAPIDALTRDRNSAFLESWVIDVQDQFCLGCHDNNGAMSFQSRVPGGSALAPFSDPNAAVIDVFSQFDPSNESYHPVRAPGNNPYTIASSENQFNLTMLPPFNQGSQHDLISCFDCHATNGHGSDTSGMLLAETYFRQPTEHPLFGDAQRQFCGRCHDENVYVFSAEPGSRFTEHDARPHARPQGGGQNTQTCRGCHAGVYDSDQDATCNNGFGIGRIHGYSHTWQSCSPSSGSTTDAFLFGGYLNGWERTSAQSATCWANCHHPNGEDY